MASDRLKITQRPEIQAFLDEAHIARMATCDPSTLQPHVVPVWYEWDGKIIWISSFRSTRKITEINKNARVSLVIDTDSRGEPARAVLFEGKCELVVDAKSSYERGFTIYKRYLGEEGVYAAEPQSWLNDPDHLLIKLVPDKVYTWGFV